MDVSLRALYLGEKQCACELLQFLVLSQAPGGECQASGLVSCDLIVCVVENPNPFSYWTQV